MTCASVMLAEYVAPYDATVARKLVHEAGCVMMGKTNMDEFAIGSGCLDSAFGPCLNPWRSGLRFAHRPDVLTSESRLVSDSHVPGGSSGGSAVAVATGSVAAALGSDTGGSVRYPAALTGVVGFKPTYGSISRHGLVPLSHTLDTVGVLTRCVEDAQLVFQALAGFDPRDSTSVRGVQLESLASPAKLSQLRVGVSDDYLAAGMSAEVLDLMKETCDRLSDSGARVERVSLPHTKYASSCYTVLNSAEIASNFACFDGTEYGFRIREKTVVGGEHSHRMSCEELYEANRSHAFGDAVKGRIQAGNYFLLRDNYERYMRPAYQMRRVISRELQQTLVPHPSVDKCSEDHKVHVLLTPVTRGTALRCSDWLKQDNRQLAAQEDFCTQPANLSGMPAIAIPAAVSRDGLPLGLQLIAAPFQDNLLLSVARLMQQLFSFPSLHFFPEDRA